KLNADREDAQATYTGLTEHTFQTDPNLNAKENDQFLIDRYALDLIHTRDLGFGTRTTKFYGSLFSRDWWRENDIFVTAANWKNHTENGAPLSAIAFPQDFPNEKLVRVGNGASNYGNLRDFYTLGIDNSWDLYQDRKSVE